MQGREGRSASVRSQPRIGYARGEEAKRQFVHDGRVAGLGCIGGSWGAGSTGAHASAVAYSARPRAGYAGAGLRVAGYSPDPRSYMPWASNLEGQSTLI